MPEDNIAATTSAGFIRLYGLCVGEVVRRSPGLLVTRGGHGKPVWFSGGDLVVERELDIWSQGGDVNELARSIEGLRHDQNMPALISRVGGRA